MPKKDKIICVVGTTASGKSNLAIEIAKKFNGEIISADSRQVYKGMDLGSNKVPLTKKKNGLYSEGVRHHILNVVNPKKQFTVTNFKELAKQSIKDITNREKLPIITGGTGFYINSLVYNIEIPKVPPQLDIRKKLNKKTAEELYKKLKSLDPYRAENINPNNKQRIIRALEIIETTGNTVPKIDSNKSPYNPLFIGIIINLKSLKPILRKRLNLRLKKSMIKEIESLHKKGVSWNRLESFGLEYRYTAMYLQKKMSEGEMKEKIVNESYKYAKRQMTWFKRNKDIFWIKEKNEAIKLAQNFLKN